MTGLLELAGVSKTYWLGRGMLRRGRAVKAVDDVGFSVARGEVLGVVGESGSGKSTLARLILGMEAPTRGTVRFDGRDLSALRGDDLIRTRRRVQMVFQDPGGSLNPRKTARRVLEESLALAGVERAARGERAAALLDVVGLGPAQMGQYPHELSGGQRQRLAIARALAVSPDLVVADEPVSALDVSLAAQIMRLLLRLRDELGLTLVFISHDLALVHHLCDQVVVMQAGTIVERGTPASVLHRPSHPYTRLLIDAVPSGPPAGTAN
jgi:ABC-type glutathione transport system ATPase component